MLKLHGFPSSNYVNMVELALLEKGIPYEYAMTFPSQSPEFLSMSPRGKLPVLETPNGFVNEANVILEYLEDSGEGKPLLPSNLYERARVRSLMKEMEIYIELPARSLFLEAFFGGKLPEAMKDKARADLVAGFAALKRHASFAPFVAGSDFTLADLVFLLGAELGASVGQRLFGLDLMADIPGATALSAKLRENANVQKIFAARDAAMPGFIAAMKAKFGTA